jgi:hypothetical protein
VEAKEEDAEDAQGERSLQKMPTAALTHLKTKICSKRIWRTLVMTRSLPMHGKMLLRKTEYLCHEAQWT